MIKASVSYFGAEKQFMLQSRSFMFLVFFTLSQTCLSFSILDDQKGMQQLNNYTKHLQNKYSQQVSEREIFLSFLEDAKYSPHYAEELVRNENQVLGQWQDDDEIMQVWKENKKRILQTSEEDYGKTFYKWVRYFVSKQYNIYRFSNHKNEKHLGHVFHTILEDKIYLGMLPVFSKENHLSIKEQGIGTILSTVEPYELFSAAGEDLAQSYNVLPSDWKKIGINFYSVPAPDFEEMSIEQLSEAVKVIENSLAQGKPVYVHCKAGRSRSASAIAAYFLKHQIEYRDLFSEYLPPLSLSTENDEDFEKLALVFVEAINKFLISKRSHVKIDQVKKESLVRYFLGLNQN